MNYALIGCGRIAKYHIISAKKFDLKILALCDLDVKKAIKYVETYDLGADVKIYQDYRKMISENQIELISVATESGSHYAIVSDLISHNLNVIVEKPLALNINDADKIVALSREKKIKACVCHQNRFNPAVQAVKAALEQGRFGKITHGSVHIRWNRDAQYYARGAWRGTWLEDGGALMNQSIHGIDLLIWLIGGRVTKVFGTLRNFNHPYIQAEDFGMAVLQFDNGAVATIEGTTDVFKKSEEACLCLYGLNGSAKIGGATFNNVETLNFAESAAADFISEYVENVYGNSHPKVFEDIIHAVDYDVLPCTDVSQGRNAVEVVLAIYKSFKTGAAVDLPLKDFSTTDMEGIF